MNISSGILGAIENWQKISQTRSRQLSLLFITTFGLLLRYQSVAMSESIIPPTIGAAAGQEERAKVLLVKRITAIDNTRFTAVFDPQIKIASDPNQSHANPYWPSNYLKGVGVPEDINHPIKVKPGDEIEYTIYFLNAGNGGAKKLRICDLLTPHQTYIPGVNLAIGSGANKIIGTPAQVQYIPAGGTIPPNCGIKSGNNPNGIIVIDVTDDRLPLLPGAKLQPDRSYGLVTFRTKIK